MGVLHGRDLFTSRFTTAEISDSSGRLYFVPIKHTLGNYFITELDHQLYVFELDHTLIKTHRETATKSFDVIHYDTTHFRPLNGKTKQLEQILQINGMPKVNGLMAKTFKILGKREKTTFEPHDLDKLVDELEQNKATDFEKFHNMITFIKDLDIKEIVTPLRGVSEYIEDDLKTTRPAFLGTVVSQFQAVDEEHKKVTNKPIGAKHAWLKMAMIIMAIAMVGVLLYLAYEQGTFDFFINLVQMPDLSGSLNTISPGSGGSTPAEIMQKYPTPEALKAAIDRGEVDYDKLPSDIKKLVDGVKTPTVSP